MPAQQQQPSSKGRSDFSNVTLWSCATPVCKIQSPVLAETNPALHIDSVPIMSRCKTTQRHPRGLNNFCSASNMSKGLFIAKYLSEDGSDRLRHAQSQTACAQQRWCLQKAIAASALQWRWALGHWKMQMKNAICMSQHSTSQKKC